MNKLFLGNNLDVLDTLPDNSVDAIITDSPYGLGKEPDAVKCLQDWIDHGYHEVKGKGFMGRDWDAFVPQPILWKKCYRVLKPGGHLLSFFGTRTYDWGTLAIRLAGFEIRDCIMWVYGSGFPKSMDIGKAIDKAAGAERGKLKIIAPHNNKGSQSTRPFIEAAKEKGHHEIDDNTPITDDAKKWNGYGTALKPACEPICVARKPLEGIVIDNVLKYGTGAINIDAGRIEIDKEDENFKARIGKTINANGVNAVFGEGMGKKQGDYFNDKGRWPANFIHDGSDEVLGLFPNTKSGSLSPANNVKESTGWAGGSQADRVKNTFVANEGSAARFFYCAKTSPAERAGRKHPTIKPIALMEYLVKVFCPENAICLDPFVGSGTTALACINTGRQFIGIEQDESSYNEANQLIKTALWDDL